MSEQCFPRGGKIKRKASDLDAGKADEKFFEDQPKKKVKKQKKTKQKKTKKEGGTTDGTEDAIVQVDPLKQDDLEAQMVLLGRVKEVTEFHLLVSLPCHLVGSVPVTSISNTYSKLLTSQQDDEPAAALSELFTAGQYVSCMVTKVDQAGHKVRNTLSVNPEDVNSSLPASALGPGLVLQCAVKSEEDNVYDIDCGLAGARAVLPKSALGGAASPLVCGQVLWCLVDSVRSQDGLHTLTLSADPARLNGAEPSAEWHSLNRQTLLPGMRLPITVDKVLRGGLQVRLPRDLTGLVYKTQLDEPADCADDYNAGAAAHARVLYTLPVVRRVYLSLRPAVGRLPAAPPAADLLPDAAGERLPAQVLDADQHGVRLLLQQGGEATGAVAFAPVWHARRVGAGRWQRGEEARCTLLAYDAMDEVYIASMKSGKEAPKVAPSLTVGQKVTCRVQELVEHGCRVELDGAVFGFIPSHHLTNVPVKNLQTMFPVGKKLKCKVIHSDPGRRRLLLTHNARLVNTGLSLASDPDDVKRGRTHHWIVTKVTERGLVVTGYSELSGFVPLAFAGAMMDACFPGQILQCTVHNVRAAEEAGGERRVTLCPVEETGDQPWRGRLCRVRVTSRTADRLLVVSDDGQRAELPAGHLTDVPEHVDASLKRYKTGDELEVVGMVAIGKKVIVSAKPLFLEYTKKKRYPTTAEQVVPGLQLPGAVVRADEHGVLVSFPCQQLAGTYRVKLHGLCDGWQMETADLKSLSHRTLMLEVLTEPDAEKGFLKLSARLNSKKDEGGAPYLSRCLRELSCLVPAQPAPGDRVTGHVLTTSPAGATVRLSDGRTGVLPGAENMAAGETVTATVVQVTPAGYLSLVTGQEILPSDAQPAVTPGKVYSARVLAAPADGYVRTALLLPPAPPRLVHLPARRGLNDLTQGLPPPDLGDTVRVSVKSCTGGVVVGICTDVSETSRPGRRRKEKLSKKPAKKVCSRDKHWKKRSRSAPGARPAPKKPQSSTAIRYSRFTLQDDS